MKDQLTIELLKHLFKPNDNDKHVDPFFYEDENGVHLRPAAEIQSQKYTAEDFLTTAMELAYAGGYVGGVRFSDSHEETLRRNQIALELYQLAVETQKAGLEIFSK